MSRKMVWFALVFPTLLGFDFASKRAVEQNLPVGGEIEVVPHLVSLTHAQNPDIAFSLPVPLPLIVVGGLVVLGILAVTLWRLPARDRIRAAALGMVASGGVGNLIDRFGDGTVTDFVRVYTDHPSVAPWLVDTFGTATWPIFNVADAALLVGVAVWALAEWRGLDPDEPEPEPA